jgi:ParB-like chromosome segregation protein Spo0J
MIPIYCKYDILLDAEALHPHPKNPNLHPERQMDALVAYISRAGWRHPVIVSRLSGCVVAGHARRTAAIRLGCKVPVVEQDFETDADELAFVLADNRLAELAEIDENLLEAAISDLDLAGWDVSDIGFSFDLGFEDPVEGDSGGESPLDTFKASYDEVKVFVLPAHRKELISVFKDFQSKHGEAALRWQKK